MSSPFPFGLPNDAGDNARAEFTIACTKLWRDKSWKGDILSEYYAEDFKSFSQDNFSALPEMVKRDLRDLLGERGVYLPKRRNVLNADALRRVIDEELPCLMAESHITKNTESDLETAPSRETELEPEKMSIGKRTKSPPWWSHTLKKSSVIADSRRRTLIVNKLFLMSAVSKWVTSMQIKHAHTQLCKGDLHFSITSMFYKDATNGPNWSKVPSKSSLLQSIPKHSSESGIKQYCKPSFVRIKIRLRQNV